MIATAAVASPPAPGIIQHAMQLLSCGFGAGAGDFSQRIWRADALQHRDRIRTSQPLRAGSRARGLAVDHADGLGTCPDDQAASRRRFTRAPTPDGDAARSPWRRSQAPSSPRSPAREHRGWDVPPLATVTSPYKYLVSEVIESKFPGMTAPPASGKSNWKDGPISVPSKTLALSGRTERDRAGRTSVRHETRTLEESPGSQRR